MLAVWGPYQSIKCDYRVLCWLTPAPCHCHVDARLLGFSKELFHGFVMVVDMKGTVVYASENITEQLGPQLVSVCSGGRHLWVGTTDQVVCSWFVARLQFRLLS